MPRTLLICILLLYPGWFLAFGQQGPAAKKNGSVLTPVDPATVSPFLSDSAINASRQKFLRDSVATAFLMPDSARKSQLWEHVLKTSLYNALDDAAPSQSPSTDQKIRAAS